MPSYLSRGYMTIVIVCKTLPPWPELNIPRPPTHTDVLERANPCWYDAALAKAWEARCRLLMLAVEDVLNNDYDNPCTFLEEAWKQVGPLPKESP